MTAAENGITVMTGERLTLRLITLISDVKATANDMSADERERYKAGRAYTAMYPALRRRGYDPDMLPDGDGRDTKDIVDTAFALWHECIRNKQMELAHDVNRLVTELTLVEATHL